MLTNTPSLADPQGASTLVAAATWLQGTLLGTFATIIAIIAVASIGLLMLLGELDLRRGLTVITGCFILFGAPTLAAGLRSIGGGDNSHETPQVFAPTYPIAIAPAPSPRPSSQPYDPYAGASVNR